MATNRPELVDRVCFTCGFASGKPLDEADADHLAHDGAHLPSWHYEWPLGLHGQLYKYKGGTAANGGISERVDEVTIVGIAWWTQDPYGTYEIEKLPTNCRHANIRPAAPPAIIVHRKYSFGNHAFVQPVGVNGGHTQGGWMASGVFVDGDSRFSDLAGPTFHAIKLHDRREGSAFPE